VQSRIEDEEATSGYYPPSVEQVSQKEAKDFVNVRARHDDIEKRIPLLNMELVILRNEMQAMVDRACDGGNSGSGTKKGVSKQAEDGDGVDEEDIGSGSRKKFGGGNGEHSHGNGDRGRARNGSSTKAAKKKNTKQMKKERKKKKRKASVSSSSSSRSRSSRSPERYRRSRSLSRSCSPKYRGRSDFSGRSFRRMEKSTNQPRKRVAKGRLFRMHVMNGFSNIHVFRRNILCDFACLIACYRSARGCIHGFLRSCRR